jgi:hypothetical protein
MRLSERARSAHLRGHVTSVVRSQMASNSGRRDGFERTRLALFTAAVTRHGYELCQNIEHAPLTAPSCWSNPR